MRGSLFVFIVCGETALVKCFLRLRVRCGYALEYLYFHFLRAIIGMPPAARTG